jgi:hypothetical protein
MRPHTPCTTPSCPGSLKISLSIEDAPLLSPGQGPGNRRRHVTGAKQSPERTPLDATAPDAREGNEASRLAPSGLWAVRGCDLRLPQGFTLG